MTSGHERRPGGLRRLGGSREPGGSRELAGSRELTGSRRLGGSPRRSSRRELVVALVLGAAGAGLIFLATRQGWAEVRTVPPRPLPASLVGVTGAALIPYADALVLVGLATLAAVLASRGLARRLTGVLMAGIGIALGVSAFALSSADAISAATSSAGPATASAGSVTGGSGSAPSAVPNVAGTASHVSFVAAGWQVMVVAGALAMIAAGILVMLRAERMAVMSSRYDSPAGGGQHPAPEPGRQPAVADSASMWEALSRGDDPTSAGSRPTGAGSTQA